MIISDNISFVDFSQSSQMFARLKKLFFYFLINWNKDLIKHISLFNCLY